MLGVNYTVSECLHIGNNIYNEEWTTAQRPWQHPHKGHRTKTNKTTQTQTKTGVQHRLKHKQDFIPGLLRG